MDAAPTTGEKEDASKRCGYVLSEILGYRCCLPAGHEGSHRIEVNAKTKQPPLPQE